VFRSCSFDLLCGAVRVGGRSGAAVMRPPLPRQASSPLLMVIGELVMRGFSFVDVGLLADGAATAGHADIRVAAEAYDVADDHRREERGQFGWMVDDQGQSGRAEQGVAFVAAACVDAAGVA